MKVAFPIIGLLTSAALFSCNSADNKVKNAITSNDTTITQQKSIEKQINADTNSHHQADVNTINLVKHKLGAMFKDDLSKNLIDKESRKFKLFEYNINEDPKKEIFVGLTGSYFCGSGGCTLLLLNPEGELINRFTVTDYPISIANTNTKGWKDLILTSNDQDHLMKFNGKNYPSNPSVQAVYSSSSTQNSIKGLDTSGQLYNW